MARVFASLVAAAGVLSAAVLSSAQTPPVDLSSFYQGVSAGTGARAWGMGGTQIALADGAEAVTWNPAAAARVERPTVFGVLLFGDRLTGDFDQVRFTLSSGPSGSITPGPATGSGSGPPAIQLVYPMRVAGRSLAAGVSYRRRLALPESTDATLAFRGQSLYTFDYDYRYGASGSGGFDTVGFSVSSDLGHGIRAGATLNRWFGTVSSSYLESYHYSVTNYYGWDGTWDEFLGDDLRLEVSGFSVDVGAQFDFLEKYSGGLVYRSRTAADVNYSNVASYQDTHASRRATANHDGSGTLTLPASLGLGFAARVLPRLTLALDQSWTFWSEATIDGYARANALGGVPQAASFSYPTVMPADQHEQSDVARTSVGAEYRLARGRAEFPLRAGWAWQQAYYAAGSAAVAVTVGGGVRWRGLLLDVGWVREAASGRYARQLLMSTVGWEF